MNLLIIKPVNESKGADEIHIVEDRLERPKKRDNTYESYKIDMVDYSSTGGSVESDVNVTISTQVYRYLNVFL